MSEQPGPSRARRATDLLGLTRPAGTRPDAVELVGVAVVVLLVGAGVRVVTGDGGGAVVPVALAAVVVVAGLLLLRRRRRR